MFECMDAPGVLEQHASLIRRGDPVVDVLAEARPPVLSWRRKMAHALLLLHPLEPRGHPLELARAPLLLLLLLLLRRWLVL